MAVRSTTLVLISALILPACGGQERTLPRPFSAEQIREEWSEGFTLTLRRTTSEGEELERWTVVGADAEGAEIEFAVIDAAGNVVGQPRVQRSGWVELRDHASFPVARAAREEVVRQTPLGMLDGWLYTVRDDDAGSVTEYFFADSLPGAPVQVRERHGDAVVMELVQIERSKPGEY